MAEETTRVVEPEEIQLTSETPVSTSTVAEGPAQQAPQQTGDDELDGDMDAIERAIDDPSAASDENIAGLGTVHTGSRRDLDPSSLNLGIEARPTEEGQLNRDPVEAPAVTTVPQAAPEEQAAPARDGQQPEATVQQAPTPRRDDPVTETQVAGTQDTAIVQPAAAVEQAPLVQQAAPTLSQVQAAPVEETTVELPPAVAPGLSIGPQTTPEDTGLALNLNSLIPAAGETVRVVISGLPPGTVLNRGTQSGDTWILTGADLPGLVVTPPENYSGSVTMRIEATTTGLGGDSATSSYAVPLTVIPVADQPPVSITPANPVDEDTAVALNIDTRLVDTDGSEVLSVQLAGVPAGATLSAGTRNADGTWSLTSDQLAGLTMTPPKNFSGTINLTVTSTSTETANGDAKSSVASTSIVITPVADAADVTVKAATGKEDNDITLDVSAALTDTDGSEVMSVVISNVPAGAVLSQNGKALAAGPDGSYTLTPAQLAGLSVKPPVNSDDDFTLKISVTTTETANGNSKTVAVDLPVTVTPVADTPTLTGPVGTIAGTEDTAVTLDIASALTDSTNETLSIRIEGVPANATLKSGATLLSANADGSYTLRPEQLASLTLKPGENDRTPVTLKVTATSTEVNPAAVASEQQASTSIEIPITFKSVVDGGTLTLPPATGKEDSAISLSVTPVLKDASENVDFITINNIPTGAKFNVGHAGANGSWIVDKADISSLTVTPLDYSDDDFTLSVTLTVSDGFGNTITSDAQDLKVEVTPVANAPTLTGPVGTIPGTEGTAVTLDITSALTDMTNESLSIRIEGVPTNAILKSGDTTLTANPDHSYTLTPEQLKDLTLDPGKYYRTPVTLKVTATSTEANTAATASEQQASTSIEIPITFKSVVDGGTLTMSPATGKESSEIRLSVTPVLPDASETVDFITISNIPSGARFNVGHAGANGSWIVDKADISSLTVSPLDYSDDDFTLSVTLTVSDGFGNTITSDAQDLKVEVTPVANAPTLTGPVGTIPGTEGTAVTLDITSALTDMTNESLSIRIEGVPTNAILKSGDTTLTANPDHSYTLTPEQLKDLTLDPGKYYRTPVTLKVTATSTEANTAATASEQQASTSIEIPITFKSVVDGGTLTMTPATGKEDSVAISLSVTPVLKDASETVDHITISNIPSGATFNVGHAGANGTWIVDKADIGSLSVKPPANSDDDFTLSVTLTVSDGFGNTITSDAQDLAVTVRPTEDAPVASVAQAVVSTNEDVAVGLGLSAVKTDTDGSEDLTVEISGIPAGGKILDATGKVLGVSNGTLTLTEAQIKAAGGLDALQFKAPDNASGEWTLTVKATSTEKDTSFGVVSASDTTHVTIKVAPVVDADAQNFTLNSIGTKEGTDVALGIAIPGTLGADTDGSETVTKVTISGLDPNAKLVSSLDVPLVPNADGNYELTPSQLSGLKYRPAPDSDVDDVLSVTFSVKDQNPDGSQVATTEITKTMTVRIDAVAETPTLTLTDASGKIVSGPTLGNGARQLVEDAGDYPINLVAVTGDPGDANESVQSYRLRLRPRPVRPMTHLYLWCRSAITTAMVCSDR